MYEIESKPVWQYVGRRAGGQEQEPNLQIHAFTLYSSAIRFTIITDLHIRGILITIPNDVHSHFIHSITYIDFTQFLAPAPEYVFNVYYYDEILTIFINFTICKKYFLCFSFSDD